MVSLRPDIILGPSLDRLRSAVLEQNKLGSVDGLLAHHILRDCPWVNIHWQVLCTSDWIRTEYRSTNAEHIAALGYSASETCVPDLISPLSDGLARITHRDAFKGDHLSLAYNPSRLLGIYLGAVAAGGAGKAAIRWCNTVLEKIQQVRVSSSDPLMRYLFYLARNTKISAMSSASTLYELAFLEWANRRQYLDASLSIEKSEEVRQQILCGAATNLSFESAGQAALIWESVTSTLSQMFGTSPLQAKDVGVVLRNFESAMKRWRWDGESATNPIRWPIEKEREIQDILWIILRSYFRDAEYENTLPKLGHSSYRADFTITSLKLIVEVKFAKTANDFKRIEKEVQEDYIPYIRDNRFESIIVFIYDHSASVQEHETTRMALLEIANIVDVVIVSRPSQLPYNS